MTGGGPDGSRSGEHGSGTWGTAPDADEFHRLLSSTRRRRVLYFLREHREASLAELSDVLAGWRAVDEDRAVERRGRDGIRVSLHHTDLPMLDDGGLLAYDRDGRAVSMPALPADLAAILRHSRAYERKRRETRTDAADAGR